MNISKILTVKGNFERNFIGEYRWDVNYSAILSELINTAGRYCEHYSSDLFLHWQNRVEKNLTDPEWKGGTILFGFYANGVNADNENVTKLMNDNGYYFRCVMELKIEITADKIKMQLKRIR